MQEGDQRPYLIVEEIVNDQDGPIRIDYIPDDERGFSVTLEPGDSFRFRERKYDGGAFLNVTRVGADPLHETKGDVA